MRGRRKNLKIEWRRKDHGSSSSSSAPPPPPPQWIELPREITASILQRLSTVDILESAQKVCTTWRSVCQDPAMNRKIDMPHAHDAHFDPEIMCQHAVDRSRRQLVDIKIGYFGSDRLLKYVAERSGQLKSLSLANCDYVTPGGLTDAINMLPLLEELDLNRTFVPCKTLKVIGRCCPFLKSLTLSNFTRSGTMTTAARDNEAIAIAKTMPQLRHLGLLGSTSNLSNKGLVAILDGCTHLESLYIWKRYKVYLRGDLGRRCSQQLKVLRQLDDDYIKNYDNVDDEDEVDSDDDSFYGYRNDDDEDEVDSDDDSFLNLDYGSLLSYLGYLDNDY